MIKKEDLKKLIEIEKKTAREISIIYKCSISNVYIYCRKYKIKWPERDLVGKKYHWLEVIEKIGSRGESGKQSIYWKVKCKCGNIIERSTKSINREENKSCGCYINSKEYSRNNYLWNGHGDIHGKFWNNIVRGAEHRGHIFDISIEYAWNLYIKQNKKCALSGMDIVFAKTTRGWQHGECTASLDRIDSKKGYIKGNVQWVHKDINLAKQSITQKEFIELCKKVYLHSKN